MLANGNSTNTCRKVSWSRVSWVVPKQLPTQGRASLPEGSDAQSTISAADDDKDGHMPHRIVRLLRSRRKSWIGLVCLKSSLIAGGISSLVPDYQLM
ncbi:MAG: hypothetical protein NZM04_09565 [Methylacidiphilales bacterium]|nr:hypothetical protein [Candidatus Methylacidiphilales bacterium]